MAKRKHKKRLVLDIGTSAIRLCELSPTKEGYQLVRYLQKEILLDPAADEEEKHERQAEALAEMLKEGKIRRRKAIIAVPGQSVFTRNRPLPPVPEHKVPQIVRYEIQQQIPFSLDQIALDYQVLDRTEAGGYEVMMAAIKVDVIEKQLEVLKKAKCGIDIVDISPLAAFNWLEHTGEFGDDDQCVALIDFGATTTDIVIRKEQRFKFTRSLHVGGNEITKAIAREFNMSFEDAEQVKRDKGFAPTGDSQRDGKGGEVIGRVLGRLVSEINRSFAYFRSQPGGGPVSRVILTGGGACMRNIVPYLQRELSIEVRIAQPLAGLAVTPGAQAASEFPEQSCVVLGLALRCSEEPAISVNLIPPRVRQVARQREQLVYWVLTMVALVLILGARVPMTAKNEEAARQRIDLLKQTLAQYDPALVSSPKSQSQFEEQLLFVSNDVRKARREVSYLDDLREGRGSWLPYLKAISDARPKNGGVVVNTLVTAVFGGPENTGPQARANLAAYNDALARGEQPEVVFALNSTVDKFRGIGPGNKGGKKKKRGKKNTSGATGENAPAEPITEPNGFILYGYASTIDTLRRFVERLDSSGTFIERGVYWYKSYTESVSESVLGGPDMRDDSATLMQFHIDLQFAGDPIEIE